MADGPSSNGNGDSSSEGGIWRGLRTLLFGEENNETLRERIEDAIDEVEHGQGVAREEVRGRAHESEHRGLVLAGVVVCFQMEDCC